LITEFRGLFKIEKVLNPLIEDPCRIIFVQHLLSNIETRGKTTTTTTTRRFVDEKSEFEVRDHKATRNGFRRDSLISLFACSSFYTSRDYFMNLVSLLSSYCKERETEEYFAIFFLFFNRVQYSSFRFITIL
jgi:hypothetical protein